MRCAEPLLEAHADNLLHVFFTDNYHPVLLLKEWAYNGGCRGGGDWDFTVSFQKPEGVLNYVKSIKLVGKYTD